VYAELKGCLSKRRWGKSLDSMCNFLILT